MLQRAPVSRLQSSFVGSRPVLVKRALVKPVTRNAAVSTQAFFFGGGNKSSGSTASGGKSGAASGFYICIDCGYIYDNSAGPWNEIPSFYRCPACNSPKSRFKAYKGTDVKGKPNNAKASMQKRMKEKNW